MFSGAAAFAGVSGGEGFGHAAFEVGGGFAAAGAFSLFVLFGDAAGVRADVRKVWISPDVTGPFKMLCFGRQATGWTVTVASAAPSKRRAAIVTGTSVFRRCCTRPP